jgi:hypothetical protein
MESLKPFADDAAAISIGELKIENGRDRVAIYGTLDLTRDRTGLALACDLKALLDQVIRTLASDPKLPERIAPPEKPAVVRNPFT